MDKSPPVAAVFPLCYFPPVPWWAAALRESHIWLEAAQHFRKQQYTNRMRVKVSNQVLPLSIPIERRGAKVPIRDKKISYAEDWPRQHWRTLCSAYGASPYFEFYRDELQALYEKRPVFLLDLLLPALHWQQKTLGLSLEWELTRAYRGPATYGRDYRTAFDPGLAKLPPWFREQAYPQVFGEFVAGLSILDLLCNEGPNSKLILSRSFRADWAS